VAAVLAPAGLTLSAEKTKITHIEEGFDFLGWRIQRHVKRGTAKSYVYSYPSKKALKAVMERVRRLSRQGTNLTLPVLLHTLNYYGKGRHVELGPWSDDVDEPQPPPGSGVG
jgi:RNA-directed DNA polymerase